MMRSRLPVPSLLGLFGALLVLSPELLLGMPGSTSEVPVTDPRVQKALAFAVEKYNKGNRDSTSYFKVLRFTKMVTEREHHLLVELVETTCKKKPGWKMLYENIQKCKLLPGNQKKAICYFKVLQQPVVSEGHIGVSHCTSSRPP